MRYRKEFVSIWKIDIFLFVAFLTENLYNKKTKNPVRKLDIRCLHFTAVSSQSELRLPLLQVVSSNKYFSVGVQSPTEINAPRGCAVILKRRCQLALTRITHQVSRAFDLNRWKQFLRQIKRTVISLFKRQAGIFFQLLHCQKRFFRQRVSFP